MATETLLDVMAHYGVSKLSDLPATCEIVPEFYPKNSLVWTLKRLDTLPIELRERACVALRETYLKGGVFAYRDAVNALVNKHGSQENAFKVRNQVAPDGIDPSIQAKINKRVAVIRGLDSNTQYDYRGSKILKMADDSRASRCN